MKYEVGKILRFNNAEWGLIEYKNDSLSVYSISENKKVSFKVDKVRFNSMYTRSQGISKETVEFVEKEKNELKKLVKELKPGTVFVGNDGKKYTTLKANDKKIEFLKNEEVYTATIGFVKTLTKELDTNYLNHLDLATNKKDYNALTLEEKVMVAINFLKPIYKDDKDFKILELGNIIEGEAFYHEVDEYYPLIGLEIKFNYSFMNEIHTQVGFFPIYIGKVKDYYPVYFDGIAPCYDFGSHSYCNGLGDEIEIYKTLIKKEKIDKLTLNY